METKNILSQLQQFDKEIKLKDLKTYEYKVMYFFGCWVTKKRIYAENDKEAIFDADDYLKNKSLQLSTALFRGNKKIKIYHIRQEEKNLITY